MGQEILVSERIDAGADFVRDFDQFYSVAAAFWIDPADSDNLFLYVASDDINDSNFDIAYGEVSKVVRGKRSPWLDPFQIKLVSSADPIAVQAVEIRDRYAAPVATHYNGPSIGGIGIDGAYIYPPLSAMKSIP